MIHEIGVELQAFMLSRGCGFPVIDGPEKRGTTTFARERVVIEHDEDGGDSYGPRHRADTNVRTRITREVGVKITIYAQRPNKGATYWEHKRRAEQVLDMVQVGLDIIGNKRSNLVAFRSSKFVTTADLKDGETQGGAVYEAFITFDRGVADRNWDGSAPNKTVPIVAAGQSGGPVITATTTVSGSTENGGSSTETL